MSESNHPTQEQTEQVQGKTEQTEAAQSGSGQAQTTKKKPFWDGRPLVAIGFMIFVVFCACIAVFFLFYRYHGFADGWSKLSQVLQPIIFGAVIAYLINPVMKFIERHYIHFFENRTKHPEKLQKQARSWGVTGGMIFFIAVLAALFGIVLPQVITTLGSLINSIPEQVQSFTKWLDTTTNDSQIAEYISDAMVDVTDYVQTWLEDTVKPQVGDYIATLTAGVYNAIRSIINFLIGLIVAVYILFSKEKFVGQFKKIVYAFFNPQIGNKIVRTIRRSDQIFGGFIIGKLIDSLIIGVIAFVVMYIMRLPYTVLLAVIIGVTNVIPVFGPFIGAIPCFVLVVLSDPWQGLYFLIFIFILQQIDGNIIGPAILGNTTGLTSFWVIFAILIGNGFFGVIGMLLGVPVFAVIYYLIRKFIEFLLKRKELPTETDAYVKAVKIDPVGQQIIYPEDKKEK